MKKIIVAALAAAMGCMSAGAQSSHEKAKALLSQLTLDEKISLMMDSSPAIERLGIPQFNWWSEALHGVARAGRATVLPQTIGMAATFDDEALGRAFTMVSDEARAKFNGFRDGGKGIQRYEGLAFWTPNVNIFRDPRWGRGQETYGEDPYLTTRMGRAVVRGLQGDPDGKYLKTLAGAKHFAVHSGPEWNRHSFDARDIDPRDLRETYLPAFKALVDEDVAQVMCAYNRYEGEPCCSSKKLLQQILRGEWGYKNIIVSDCWAIRDFFSDWAHKTHAGEAEAGADAVISGTDLECGPVYKSLRKAYDRGLITEEVIDSAVIKLLDFRYRLGEIDNPADVPWNSYTAETHLDTPEHAALALEMARKSMTLLKNNGILPLSPSTPLRVLVMGPNATDSVMQWGNYNGFPAHTVTVLEG
ncbi:MAG: glycoside hydrolase family 3 protein, partial [Duncaniella sp.]|nr:glycoside hydrolase family 3 protein [Duncaniella sp.]